MNHCMFLFSDSKKAFLYSTTILKDVPSCEFWSQFAEQVSGTPGSSLRERRCLVGQAGGGRGPVVGSGASLTELAVEGAPTGRSSGETNTVRCGCTAYAVSWSDRRSLIGNSARAENKKNHARTSLRKHDGFCRKHKTLRSTVKHKQTLLYRPGLEIPALLQHCVESKFIS